MNSKFPVVVLISGNGSNLQAIMDSARAGSPIDIRAVISNNSNAFGLERAQKAGIPTHAISHQDYKTRQEFEQVLRKSIDSYQPRLIILAGFMRQLTPEFVKEYEGKIINIHPSLLPKYPGLNTHRKVLKAKDSSHGITIHYVNDEVDGGPIICQAAFTVHPDDTEASLQERAHQLEHKLYPQVIEWIAQGRLRLQDEVVYFDNKLINEQGIPLSSH